MSAKDHDLRAGVAELVTESREQSSGRHVEIEALAGYLDGTLDEQRALELREHLLDCPTCTDRLLDLDALRSAEAGEPTPLEDSEWDLARAESWERIRASLPQPTQAPAADSPRQRLSSRPAALDGAGERAPIWPWLALGAAAIVFAGKLAGRLIRRLRRRRRDQPPPSK